MVWRRKVECPPGRIRGIISIKVYRRLSCLLSPNKPAPPSPTRGRPNPLLPGHPYITGTVYFRIYSLRYRRSEANNTGTLALVASFVGSVQARDHLPHPDRGSPRILPRKSLQYARVPCCALFHPFFMLSSHSQLLLYWIPVLRYGAHFLWPINTILRVPS